MAHKRTVSNSIFIFYYIEVFDSLLFLNRIFIISQDDGEIFNRAMLFNVGYMEAKNLMDFNCSSDS